jgi:TrmH family RNA methyltransferase
VVALATPETGLHALEPHHLGLIVVLDRLQDPGNAGTLIRTTDAAGAGAVILIEPCVDAFDPKTVRGSMGSLFNVPLAQTADVGELFEWMRDNDLQAIGADAHQGQAWDTELWRGNVALILGNEARGLSLDVRPHIQHWARLPIVGKAESLNVAVAGGVFMYAWLRERQRE